MAIPATMTLTPQATLTVSDGASTDASSEFWQRIAADTVLVYTGVPYSLMQNLLQSRQPDTAIAIQLAAYPKRVTVLY